jgi:hypothetical protein
MAYGNVFIASGLLKIFCTIIFVLQNINKGIAAPESETFERYDQCLCHLLDDLFRKGDHKET